MGVIYTKTDQSSNVSTGTGVPTHSAVAGDRYTNLSNGNTYQYTTSWQQVAYGAGGLTYFTEAQSTASPNATVNVDSLTAIASTTNADFVIAPKGTGAILAQIPDNTATGGNKRGPGALDLQTYRNAAAQVSSGDYSVSLGIANKASGFASFALGSSNAATNTCSVAIGNQTISSGLYSFAIGDKSTASGESSMSSGLYAIASGYSSLAIGRGSNATNDYSISLGFNAISSNSGSVAIGQTNTADGANSLALGTSSNTFGITGRQVFASNNVNAQKSTLILRKNTTDATPSIISVTGSGTITASIQLTLQNNNSIRFKGTIIGRQSGSTNTSAWDIDGIIQRGTSAATTTLLISNVNVVQNTPAWGTPTLAANTTLGCLTVNVIGALTTNIQWTATIESTEVIYA